MKKLLSLRLLALVLCLLMVVSAFAACNPDAGPVDESTDAPSTDAGSVEGPGDETEPETTVPPVELTSGIKISEYQLIIPEEYTSAMNTVSVKFNKAAKAASGGQFRDFGTDFTKERDKEILIGATERAESAEALKELDGEFGYVIKQYGDKIVIGGPTDFPARRRSILLRITSPLPPETA